MSDLCCHCGVVSRNACSTYREEYLAEELSNCPNLDRESQLLKAALAEGWGGTYSEQYEQSMRDQGSA